MSEEDKDQRRVVMLPATLDSAVRKKDFSVKVTAVTTKEVSSQDLFDLDKLFTSGHTIGYLFFVPNGMSAPEVPKEDVPEKGKSLSERLYNALFVLWKKEAEADGEEFEAFRRRNMESLISFVKEKISEHD